MLCYVTYGKLRWQVHRHTKTMQPFTFRYVSWFLICRPLNKLWCQCLVLYKLCDLRLLVDEVRGTSLHSSVTLLSGAILIMILMKVSSLMDICTVCIFKIITSKINWQRRPIPSIPVPINDEFSTMHSWKAFCSTSLSTVYWWKDYIRISSLLYCKHYLGCIIQ